VVTKWPCSIKNLPPRCVRAARVKLSDKFLGGEVFRLTYLDFIPDDRLFECTRDLLGHLESAHAEKDRTLYKNVLDPFGALFEAQQDGYFLDDWIAAERARQVQKTFQNHLGTFHERILGSMEGWTRLGNAPSRVDLTNKNLRIIAEVKNKFNTITGTRLPQALSTLTEQARTYRAEWGGDVTAYLVYIIPQKPAGITKLHKKVPRIGEVQIIDGARFYDLASGEEDALAQLFYVLPDVIASITGRYTSEDGAAELRKSFSNLYTRAYGGAAWNRVELARGGSF